VPKEILFYNIDIVHYCLYNIPILWFLYCDIHIHIVEKSCITEEHENSGLLFALMKPTVHCHETSTAQSLLYHRPVVAGVVCRRRGHRDWRPSRVTWFLDQRRPLWVAVAAKQWQQAGAVLCKREAKRPLPVTGIGSPCGLPGS
jgi:hypothetical protein